MRCPTLTFLSFILPLALADDDPAGHGEGDLGNTMGPVAFLWPSDRHWTADADNRAPCGSTAGVGDRTQYPLSKCIDMRV